MAKLVQISDDSGSNWYTLPGGEGEINRESVSITDTIFGQTFDSQEVGLISASVSANALYKGFAGYVADIKQQGTPTAMTAEAMSLVSGKTYQIDDAAKAIWDRSAAITVLDNAIDHTADVVSYDPLFGTVTFDSSYSVTTPVTVTGTYLPTVVLGKGNSFSLGMTANAIDTTTFEIAQGNGGYQTNDPGLRAVSVQLDGIYALASGLAALLVARTELIIEINPDGNAKSVARGFFKTNVQGQSGEVGALEEEGVTFNLNVPESGVISGGTLAIDTPFSWEHAADTTLSTAIQKILTAWLTETKLDVRYLHDGTNGDSMTAVVTDVSMSTGLSDMNDFSCEFTADGATAAVP